MLAVPFDLNRLRSRYETIAPWSRERAYSQLCALLRSMLLDDGHRFIALVAWSDSAALLSCIETHRCASLLAEAIRRFKLEDDARCAGLCGILLRQDAGGPDDAAVRAQCTAVAERLRQAHIAAIVLEEGPQPEFLIEEKNAKAAAAIAGGAVVSTTLDATGVMSADTSFAAMVPHAVQTAPGSYSLNLVGKALYLAVRALSRGIVLRDIYFLAGHLRAMSERERGALRIALSLEKRERTRLEGIVEFASSLAAVDWDGSLGAKAYAAWLRRSGDLPYRLRARVQGVEAGFALRGGVRHAMRVLRDGGTTRETFARVGSSVAGGVYALFL